MQIIYGVLLLALFLILLLLIKKMHFHASLDTAEQNVKQFLEEHLETHNAKKQLQSPQLKNKKTKKA